MVLDGPHYAQNGEQMDKESNGMATKKWQEKEARAGQAEIGCRMEYTNIRQRKVEGVGKGLCPAVD